MGEGGISTETETLPGPLPENSIGLKINIDDTALETVSGFRKGTSLEKFQIISCLRGNPELRITIKKRTGEEIAPNNSQLYPLEEGDKLIADGKVYEVKHDPWCNVMLVEEGKKKVANPENISILNKVIGLWEAAIASEEELNNFLEENIEEGSLEEMREALEYLKSHPTMQQDLAKIDPWFLANLPNQEAIVAYLSRDLSIPYSFLESEEFQTLVAIVEKIRRGEQFSPEEILFLNALSVSDLATQLSIHDTQTVRITPFNERYALANLAENYLMRSLVPSSVFQQHANHYTSFSRLMTEQKVKMPEWFSPYRGEEFTYGPANGRTIANAGGKYFLDIFGENKESMAHVLDHERIHALISHARQLQYNKVGIPEKYQGFSSEETYVETLSLIIKYQGDVKAILQGEEIDKTTYANACRQLLKILEEINERSEDPLMATKLLVEGLVGIAEGYTKGLFEPIKNYYDANFEGPRFAERMAAFSDERKISVIETPAESPNLSRDNIRRALLSVSLEDIKAKSWWLDQESYGKIVELYTTYPLLLLGNLQEGEKLFLERIISNHEAKKEMQEIVDSYYRNYLEMIKRRIEKDSQKIK